MLKLIFKLNTSPSRGQAKVDFRFICNFGKKIFSTFSHPHFKLNNMKQKIEFDPSARVEPFWYSRTFFKNRKIGNRAEKFLYL